MRTFRLMVISSKAAAALDQRSHIVQVTAIGAFKSKAAFARALVAAELGYDERSTLREMARYGGETWNQKSVEVTSAAPEQIFVEPVTPKQSDHIIPWPPQENVAVSR